MNDLRIRHGAGDGPSVLMLHGLGATCDVWDGVAAELVGRKWVAPDLPGHGGSRPLSSYSFGAVAAAVAGLIDPSGTVVVGHSFGGVVGLHLAACPGVRAVVGVGIKVAWSDEELDGAAALAARPARVYATREEAVARHLRVTGLDGLVGPSDPALDAGVTRDGDGWRLALDASVFGIGEPGVAALLATAAVPVVLARGEHDPMVATAQLRALVADPVELPGLGHNAHVEGSAAVAGLLTRFF